MRSEVTSYSDVYHTIFMVLSYQLSGFLLSCDQHPKEYFDDIGMSLRYMDKHYDYYMDFSED